MLFRGRRLACSSFLYGVTQGPFDEAPPVHSEALAFLSGIWVTQLVVDALFRVRRIARTLLKNCFGRSDVWGGLLSSHPYAVRAFEAATECACDPTLILRIGLAVLQAADIDYAANAATTGFQRSQCVLDTQFFVNHSNILRLLRGNTLGGWTLGNDLRDGEGFICIVRRRADGCHEGGQ